MRKKLVLLLTAILLGLSLLLAPVAFAGGDQVQRPDESPQYQAGGDSPNQYKQP